MRSISILGTRGIPAAHGGFETFAEALSLYLARLGWRVTVYCQGEAGTAHFEDEWSGVRRVHIPSGSEGPLGTIVFDWKSTLHAAKSGDLCLVLGYNTAMFMVLLRLLGVASVINMDGIEWKRAKWGPVAKLWFWLNERAGCWLGNHLVADHPEIKRHLATRVHPDKITTIAYGAERIDEADTSPLGTWGLEPGRFLTVIARAEPENSILEIVEGFSSRPRGVKLVVLGNYDPSHAYQKRVLDAASGEVVFAGAIYDKSIVRSLRFHSAAYVHGHQVGGTNPSLVEALGAGNAVIAHGNRFNRWVAGDSAMFFGDSGSFSTALDEVLSRPELLVQMRAGSRHQFETAFTWESILSQYEQLLGRFVDSTPKANT